MRKPAVLKLYVFVLITILNAVCVSFAQNTDISFQKEIDELKQGQQAIRKELLEIKVLLSKIAIPLPSQQLAPQPPPQENIIGTEFDIGENPVIGSETSKIIMTEFTDYQCPFCGRYARETFPKIKEQYIDKGAIRYTVIDQPLIQMHPEAAKGAEAAHCAKDQGKFWEMHEEIMSRQEDLNDLSSYAKSLSLNIEEFDNCLKTEKYKETVIKNMELANKLEIVGVPSFIIGTVDENDSRKVKSIFIIRGAIPLDAFQRGLDSVLNNQ